MKKFLVLLIILTLSSSTFFASCKEDSNLLNNVSVLVNDVYQAEYKGLVATANYGYTEEPFCLDGKKGETYYYLNVTLPINEGNATYKIKIDGIDGEWLFNYNLSNSNLVAKIPLSNHMDCFDATVICESEHTPVNFESILPKNILPPKEALSSLERAQKTYIDSYKSNGVFNAEIILKVSVFKNNAYYYVAIATNEQNYKAMLINGISGELLAIRDVY